MTLTPPALTIADAITVRPGQPLSGTVQVDGSKNAALPLLAAAAATRLPVHLDNVPRSADVQVMLTLLQECGFRLARPVTNPTGVVILPQADRIVPPDLLAAAQIRASYYLVPVLLGTCGQAKLPWPGGCSIGDRGMDLHFKVYAAFGDRILVDDTGYRVIAAETPSEEVRVSLPFRSRGASVAAVLRAVVGGHRLLLDKPNLSPEFTGMCRALSRAGWQVDLGEATLTVAPLTCARVETVAWIVPGDKVEAGTLACAIAATGGSGRIEGVRGEDVAPVVEALNWLGVSASFEPGALVVHGDTQPTGRPLRAVASLAPDGLDADFEPALMALALGLPGTHVFADSINPGRHGNLLPQLSLLGAEIEGLSPTQCRLTGPQRLTGAAVEATDIRTGSALLVAALTARGTSTVTGLSQLRRGHADLPAKLRALGADIAMVAR
ncbi:UDP-N-acetylglucosamine 1-carboxyvinyltransferase [Kitasatospora sp. NPDC006697]|uniref:UDP-N-acetylglucosamine 1-carboxyvinyltransferase n=1 Tax=Kitasatospora sp. NPDC006697 TaxID=3364020 RepID=UPI0036CC97B1